VLSKLKEIVSEGGVSAKESDLIVYSFDSSIACGKAKVVVWPQRTEQIVRIVELAKREGFDIVPRGGGTGLAGGAVPQGSVVLDTSKMNRIVDTEELSVEVEPGVILEDLNQRLKGIFFPVIPSSHRVCTIGGMIACNAVGTRAVRYGRTSDWVLELEVVDGRAEVINQKGPGHFCGTEGVLGIITKAKLKLAELPQVSVSFEEFDDERSLIKRVKELDLSRITALEFIDKRAAHLAGFNEKNYLLIEREGQENKESEIWRMRDEIYPALASRGFYIIEDPLLPLETIPDFLKWLVKNEIPSFGHIGVGIIHPCFSHEQRPQMEEMFKLVRELGGKVSGEHGIGLLKKRWTDEEFISKIKALKERHDPYMILNREKLV
jgi:glycolate oxidase